VLALAGVTELLIALPFFPASGASAILELVYLPYPLPGELFLHLSMILSRLAPLRLRMACVSAFHCRRQPIAASLYEFA